MSRLPPRANFNNHTHNKNNTYRHNNTNHENNKNSQDLFRELDKYMLTEKTIKRLISKPIETNKPTSVSFSFSMPVSKKAPESSMVKPEPIPMVKPEPIPMVKPEPIPMVKPILNSIPLTVLKEETMSPSKTSFFDKKKTNEKPQKRDSDILFFPRQKDTLFWCFYIMKNGVGKYEMLGDIYFPQEKKIKIEMIQTVREKKHLLKKRKVASITHIENALSNEDRIDLKTFWSLCILYELPFVLLRDKTFFKYGFEEEDDVEEKKESDNENVFVVVEKKLPFVRYACAFDMKPETLQNYKKSLYHIENIDKPLKAIGNYKSDELIQICEKLDLPILNATTGKKKTKPELFEMIVQYL